MGLTGEKRLGLGSERDIEVAFANLIEKSRAAIHVAADTCASRLSSVTNSTPTCRATHR